LKEGSITNIENTAAAWKPPAILGGRRSIPEGGKVEREVKGSGQRGKGKGKG